METARILGNDSYVGSAGTETQVAGEGENESLGHLIKL